MMLRNAKRLFTLLKKNESLSHLRNQPNNIIAEYVKDFKSLSKDEQELLYHRMFLVFSTSVAGFTYEDYKDYFTHLPGPYTKLIMLKERKFNTDVGMSLFVTDEVYLNDNDFSRKNMYLSSYFALMLAPHYRGGNLGRAMYDLSQHKLRTEFPNTNRVSYNTTLNSYYYEYRSELTPLVFPGPNPMPTDGPERLIKKIMKIHSTEGVSEDKPYVVFIPALIPGADIQRYKQEKNFKSKAREYFITQTGLEYGQLLANVAIYHLVDGNTLGIPGGSYEKIPKIEIEMNDYKPLFN